MYFFIYLFMIFIYYLFNFNIHLFIHAFIRSLIHAFIHSFTFSFIKVVRSQRLTPEDCAIACKVVRHSIINKANKQFSFAFKASK